MSRPGQLPPVARSVRPDTRSVRWVRFLLLVAAAAVFGLLYLLSEGFRSETNRALGMLGRGDIAGIKGYILLFGVWAPVPACFLMVPPALVPPGPPSLTTSASGLAFGVLGG